MIAWLFPLRIRFPVPLTAHWLTPDRILRQHFMPGLRQQLEQESVFLRYLEGKKR